MTIRYVCSGCGLRATEINRARPSLDDRYAVGYCDFCTPWPKPKKQKVFPFQEVQPERKTIQLVHPAHWNQAAFDHRLLLQHKRTLAARLDPKRKSKYSKEELIEAQKAVAWLMRDTAEGGT